MLLRCSATRVASFAAQLGARRSMSAAAVPRVAAPPHVVTALRAAAAVAFDVDSTVITTEGIDELAAFAGRGGEVAALTARAMGGSVPFRDALAARLGIIQPSRSLLESFLARHPPSLTPGIARVVAALHARGTAVYLVSGGFTQMIHPIADLLAIPRTHVYANTILFDGPGAYAGFDENAPTSRDGGKAAVVGKIKAHHGGAPVIMVGDGATDLQARPPADVVIGYGGIVSREVMRKGADWFVVEWEGVEALVQARQ